MYYKKIDKFLNNNDLLINQKLKIKFKDKISTKDVESYFIKYPNLENVFFNKNKIIFIFKHIDIPIIKESSIQKNIIQEDSIILEASTILNISYQEAFSLKDIIYEFKEKKDLEISDSLINSFFYIFKQRLNKSIEKENIILFLSFLTKLSQNYPTKI